MPRCCTCFAPVQFPRTVQERNAAGHLIRNVEQCVDPCHDEHVLGRHGADATFLRAAIKAWRGTTAQASVRMYGRKTFPVLQE